VCTIVNKKYDRSGINGMTICEESMVQSSNVPHCYVICTFHFFLRSVTDNIDVDTVPMSEALAIVTFIRYMPVPLSMCLAFRLIMIVNGSSYAFFFCLSKTTNMEN
jgi:hypothetical protein